GVYTVNLPEMDGVAYQVFSNKEEEIQGIFNVGLQEGYLDVSLKDGKYRNYLTNKMVKVENGKIKLSTEPIIVKFKK
ncbi:MAG: hypothetical protein RBS19_12155, partial [Bacteroidales bacterium]|nr:hypothetical protein [Bacteroidales bacterium]